jgi:predicted phage gp36 major capsid-like protein
MMVRLAGLFSFWLAVAAAVGGGLVAQQPPVAERLRQQVMQRFLESYRVQAGLTPEQQEKFGEVFRRSLQRREELQRRQRELWEALEGQMRPGVAADPDSVTKLMDAILANGAALLEQTRSEQREYAAFLTPVQRAQLFILWERFQRQIEQVRWRMGPMRGPPGGY